MKVQVLVSTMHQTDYSLIEKMNIQTDAIVINQCDRNEFSSFSYQGNHITFISLAERGVGLSRNNALMRSNADICLMADDDMVYVDGYKDIVVDAFRKNLKADMILFNVPIYRKDKKPIIKVKKNRRIRFYNSLKYGTVNIAFRRESIIKKNIFFSLLFGGGAKYGSGEDSLFIVESLKKGLKVYSSKEVIANIYEEEGTSTWFTGYNEKYFFDRGALFQAIGGHTLSYLLMFQFLIRKRNLYSSNISFSNALRQMVKGKNDFVKTRFY